MAKVGKQYGNAQKENFSFWRFYSFVAVKDDWNERRGEGKIQVSHQDRYIEKEHWGEEN